jgi:PleD family two-component response regulator
MFPLSSRILIIDDMDTMRQITMSHLRRGGYEHLSQAKNGEIGFSKIMERHWTTLSFDLVMADWHMPVMSGLELLKKVRSTIEIQDLPFILFTSENEAKNVIEAVLAGVSCYIVKPITYEVLKEKLLVAWQKHHQP